MDSVVFLGTSAGTPTKTKNVSSVAVRLETGRVLLVDCGEGTQHQLLRASDSCSIRLAKLVGVLITHLHGDHLFGLPGLLASLSLVGGSSSSSSQQEQFTVIGPRGIAAFVDTTLAISCTHLTYPLRVVELAEGESRAGLAEELGLATTLTVEAHPIKHVDGVACFGYVFHELPRPGTLDAKKAAALGARGPELGLLKAGKPVTVAATGAVIRPEDVVGPPKRGRSLVVLGDTCAPGEALVQAAVASGGCDVLVHEATFGVGDEELARDGGHSTSGMAGAFAARVGARMLFLTHFSQRHTQEQHHGAGVSVADLAAQAKAAVGERCEVIPAEELVLYRLPKLT